MENPNASQSANLAWWVRAIRLSYSRCGIRRGLGRAVMGLARHVRRLQLLPVRMTDGRVLYLDLRETSCMPYFLTGTVFYETGETAFMQGVVRPGEVVVDIGASVGWYSTLLGEIVGTRGRVYAFEPNATTLRMLEASAQRYPQLEIVPAAMSDREGSMELHVPADAEMGSLREFPETLTAQKCRVTTLDGFLRSKGNPTVSFIKCDVEGAELEILRGAMHTLCNDRPPMWMIEMSDYTAERFGYESAALTGFLHGLPGAGYRGFRVNSQSGELEPLPERNTFRFNAVFVPAWQHERVATYRTRRAANPIAVPV